MAPRHPKAPGAAGKVHLSDVAEKVGVSKMTVSRVLREDPAVAPATRRRVLAAARELGYVPNPRLARLMTEMALSRSRPNVLGELAYISTDETEFGWKLYHHQLLCYEGAKAKAKSYGYNLLPVWALSRRFAKGRLTDFLWSRGVDGILISPLGKVMIGKALDIDWSRFCSVQIGATMEEPPSNLVRHNHYHGMMKTLLELERLGYERIGLCLSSDSDARSSHRWASAYLYWRTIRGLSKATLPTFHYVPGQVDPREFASWVRQHGISAIVAMDSGLLRTCEEAGIRVPEDLGYSVLDHPGRGSTVAGIDQVAEELGKMAVDMLIMAVRKGAKGIPEHPAQTIIEGRWTPGATVRNLRGEASAEGPLTWKDMEGVF